MKKITIITMQLKTPGGIERFVSTLATMFINDYDVEIVINYGKSSDLPAFPLPSNIKITYLYKNQPAEISLKKLLYEHNFKQILKEPKRRFLIKYHQHKVFKNFLKNLDTDFIITERATYNFLVGKYYHGNAKKIATDHNFHQNNQKYINKLKKSLKTFDSLVVATDELKKFYEKQFPFLKCYAIPNSLEKIPTQKSPLTSKNLLTIGRLVPEKDFSALIDIMKIINEKDRTINLTIIGDGSEFKSLKQKVKSLNLEHNITFTGFLTQQEIEPYYYNSSLFVMTSKTEAFGLVLTEAMSYGLPCIAFDRASGARNLLANSLGVLIKNGDKNLMANKILELFNNNDVLLSLQQNINKYIAMYSIDTILAMWQKIII